MSTALPFPEQPMSNRLILLPIQEKEKSNLIIPVEIKKQMDAPNLMRATVMAVGTDVKLPIVAGDTVRVFPTTFEAEISVDGIGYLIYPERCIITKIG